MESSTKVRTTVTFDKDTAAAIEKLRHAKDLGLSEAVNDLIRAGLTVPAGGERKPFVQKTVSAGLEIDVSNVERALDEIEGPRRR